MTADLSNPVLNGPYDPPDHHFEIGPQGPTGNVLPGRRLSESFIPIAQAKKGRLAAAKRGPTPATLLAQEELDLDVTGERREANTLINDLRREVELWRARGYGRVTPTTRKLLEYWADPVRENRVLFCQREAAETAIFLTEVAGRDTFTDWRVRLRQENDQYNAGLPRVALKMATGSGKTVVMAMLISWQTLNKVASPRDARFAKRFLVVTPGITIRDRLRVLYPGDPGNYYDERDLVPHDLQGALRQAQIVITNYHGFLARDAKEIRGIARTTRSILLAGKKEDPFKESPDAIVARVLRDFSLGKEKSAANEIVVFNDEAHHCYRYNPDGVSKLSADEEKENQEAGVWFRGLQAVAKRVGVKAIFDMSATPFFLASSGYPEGYVFPWTVSDFSLMDSIESGIVKVPRTPVDDDAEGELVTYLRLWDFVGDKLPKRKSAALEKLQTWVPPTELEGALRSLYRSYERAHEHWREHLERLGETPPVFIVVCNNTLVSKLVYDWVAGGPVQLDDGAVVQRPGNLPLFSTSTDGVATTRPPTILVDSAQLESGESLKDDFKEVAALEIEAFKAEFRRRNPGADAEALTDEDLLREVMNTVGKKGMLGEHVRCVVSVAMLTEGWDANTVTHILGIRAFRSQLLCEQVVGRGLRRRSYTVNDDGLFEAEYANVYGIPFAFIPSDKELPDTLPKAPPVTVAAVPGREHLRISFPKVDGYRLEIPDASLFLDHDAARPLVVGPSTVPTWVEAAGIVGEAEREEGPTTPLRIQELAFAVARRLLDVHLSSGESGTGDRRPWLFPQLVRLCVEWIDLHVTVEPGYSFDSLRLTEAQADLADRVYGSLTSVTGERRPRMRPLLRAFDPVGHTGAVLFATRKTLVATEKSEVSHVTLDGKDGNTWEQILALECERPGARIAAYVKNDHLGFTIPYIHKGKAHAYIPDFLLRLERAEGEDFDRTLIVEVSGGLKSPGPTHVKADTARNSWCTSVNNHGGFGRWGYLEVTTMAGVRETLREAISNMYDDAPIIGDPDLLDFAEKSVTEERRGA